MSTAFAHIPSRRELLIFFYKYRHRLAVAFAVPFLLFVLVSFIPSPRYRAESVLIVRLGSEYVYQPETGVNQNGPQTALPFDRDQIAKSEVAILESDDLHRATLEAIGVEKLYPDTPLPKALAKFNRHFDILLKRESAVIDLAFEYKDPELAAQTLNTLLKLYLDKRRELYLEPRVELAQVQMRATQAHALATEEALADFKRTHKIYSLNDERSALLDQRSEVQKQLANISSAGLEEELQSYNRKLDELDAQDREFRSLEKEAAIASESYSLYSHRLDEARAYEDLQRERIGSVRIIQPPSVPDEPKRLQPIIIIGGFFLSLLSMLLVAAITEYSKRGFVTPEQIERHLNLPVLAVIPYSPAPEGVQ